MDEELRKYLDEKFAGVGQGFQEVRQEFQQQLQQVRQEFHQEFQQVRQELEATETRLLSEFWKGGRSTDQRTRRIEHSDATTRA